MPLLAKKGGGDMADLWMPGAERRPENNGGSMAGGPARAVWHITWDLLGKGGKQPAFDSIANYLQNVNYAPHLMWDPWTGKIVQFYPANQSARALAHPAGTAETNRMGRVCIQIEVFFTPGAVRDGKRYDTVAETPCKGLSEIMAWLRSWGVKDTWPAGWPQWSGNSRSVSRWRNESGHFGHCHVPGNDHTDPGPMPRDMFSGKRDEGEDDDMLGLKKGDKGERVKLLQLMIQAAGQGAALGKSGIDGVYGASTAEALRLVRKSVGSNAEKGFGDKVDSWALQQLHSAVARNQGKQSLLKA